jgi:acyl carrier protein
MSTPFTVQQWLSDQAVPVFMIGFALLMGFAILFVSAKTRRSSLVRDRSGRTEDTFVEELSGYGFDPEIARTTYRYLQEYQNVGFPIEPMDDLDRDLGLDSEDLKQTIRDLLDETGREHLPGLLYSPLVTVGDLVRYLQASPRRSFRVA